MLAVEAFGEQTGQAPAEPGDGEVAGVDGGDEYCGDPDRAENDKTADRGHG